MRTAAQSQILELIGQTLLGQKIPASEVWNQLMITRSPYHLDPVQLSVQYGPAAYQQAVLEQLQQELTSSDSAEAISRRLFNIDMAKRNAGISSNISGISMPPPINYPIAPDIHYKRQYKRSKKDDIATPSAPGGTVVEYINLPNTPMMDWDLPGPSHVQESITDVTNLGHLEDLLRSYISNHPEANMQVYQTPGGYRAWEVGTPSTVAEFKPRHEELHVDPLYTQVGMEPHINDPDPDRYIVQGIPTDPPGFRSRISHKPGRVDWVAQPIFRMAGAEAADNPRSAQLVDQLHDEPIRRHYLGASGVSPDAMVALQEQMPYASQTLQKELRRRFRL